jgi:seryl-tRNA synthetase
MERLGMIAVIDLPRQIDPELAADIEKESAFVSPFLGALRVTSGRAAVELEIADRRRDAEVKGKVERFLDAMLKRVHRFEPKVFLRQERRDDGPLASGVNEELLRRGWLYAYGQGHVALAGPALALAELIDAKAAALYARHFGALPRSFPAFIDADILHRCGYFDSHPNAISFVGHMVEDFDAIEAFRQANSCAEGALMPSADHVHLPGLCLNPAACFPCYPTLEGKRIGGDGAAFSWKGRVFRYESRNLVGLDRLWEFNVRELVFAGSEAHVADCRRRVLPVIGELAGIFDLECRIETASDPFFATVSAARTFWQRAQEVKNEIILTIEPGPDGSRRELACGSINLHGKFFGDRFAIGLAEGAEDGASNGTAATACVGLGIERWVLAAFSQHGFDPKRWPASIRREIFG